MVPKVSMTIGIAKVRADGNNAYFQKDLRLYTQQFRFYVGRFLLTGWLAVRLADENL